MAAATATPPNKWSVADVSAWLCSAGFSELKTLFAQNDVDGAVLLTLSDADLKDLGVASFGQRKKLSAAIAALKQPPQNPLPTVVVASPATEATEAATKTQQQSKAMGGVGARITEDSAEATTLAHLGDLVQFIPPGFSAPPLPQALQDAGVPDVTAVAGLCMDVARRAEASGVLQGTTGLTAERAAFVPAYTFDFGPDKIESNPYRVLNSSLFERNALKLGRVRGLLFGLLSALRSLPRFSAPGNVLYRGIRARVNMDSAHYRAGNTITWHGFSSATTELAVTKNYLTDSATGKCEGTLFIVKGAWGYDVQPLSCFNMEREILLEPEIDLKVASVLDAPLIVVELEMAPCPLLLESLIKPMQQPVPSPKPHQPAPQFATTSTFAACSISTFATRSISQASSPIDFEAEKKKGAEGIRNIIAALKTHAANADVCSRACGALKNLAGSGSIKTDLFFHDENKMLIAREGGIPLIIAALKTHAANAVVCSNACASLNNLARNDVNVLPIVNEGGIPLIIAALKTHAANADVCKWTFSVLCHIACNDENTVLIARYGGIEPIIAALKTHAANADVCKWGCVAIGNLAANDEITVLITLLIDRDPALAQFRSKIFH